MVLVSYMNLVDCWLERVIVDKREEDLVRSQSDILFKAKTLRLPILNYYK